MALSRVLMALFAVMALLAGTAAEVRFPTPDAREKENDHWYRLGMEDIYEALRRPRNEKVAKNVILFLGDGLGVTVTTAGRILKGQKQGHSGEEGYLLWERFPNMGLMKTYNIDKQVSDSAGTATAYLTGVKGNYKTIGLNGNAPLGDCEASLKAENRLDSILKWAQDAGKDTGVVTTVQVTHASPAGLYAKTANRNWQCDSKMAKEGDHLRACKDIARQLVEDEPGRNMNVIMGGGRQELGAPTLAQARDKCRRGDGRNLVKEWMEEKEKQGKSCAYVTSASQLEELEAEEVDHIIGLFGEIHLPFVVDEEEGAPSLSQMVQVAIRRLSRKKEGFFLMVEGGRIDHGMHDGRPRRALEELLAMEKALQVTLDLVDTEETLIVVTADHSHVMTMNGYPPRGNNILGLVENNPDVTDDLPYTTLMFTTGHGFNYTWNGKEVVRRNLTGVDTTDKDFEPLSAVPTIFGEETHGGEDVGAFAVGPMAHLFHRVHEQTYVAHVMAYSACIGPYSTCDRPRDHEQMNKDEHAGHSEGVHGEQGSHTMAEHNGGHSEHSHMEHTGEHNMGHDEHSNMEHKIEHNMGHDEHMEHKDEHSNMEHTGEHNMGHEHSNMDHTEEHSNMKHTEHSNMNHTGEHNMNHDDHSNMDHTGEHSNKKHTGEHSNMDHTAEHSGTEHSKNTEHSHHSYTVHNHTSPQRETVQVVPLEEKEQKVQKNKKDEDDSEEHKDEEEEEEEEHKDEEEEEEDKEEQGKNAKKYLVNKIKTGRVRAGASTAAVNCAVMLFLTAYNSLRTAWTAA